MRQCQDPRVLPALATAEGVAAGAAVATERFCSCCSRRRRTPSLSTIGSDVASSGAEGVGRRGEGETTATGGGASFLAAAGGAGGLIAGGFVARDDAGQTKSGLTQCATTASAKTARTRARAAPATAAPSAAYGGASSASGESGQPSSSDDGALHAATA